MEEEKDKASPTEEETKVVDDLTALLRSGRLYPIEHRNVQESAAKALRAVTSALALGPRVVVGIKEGNVLVNGKLYVGAKATVADLQKMLDSRQVFTITIERDVSRNDMLALARAFAGGPKTAKEGISALTHISFNKTRFKVIDEEEEKLEKMLGGLTGRATSRMRGFGGGTRTGVTRTFEGGGVAIGDLLELVGRDPTTFLKSLVASAGQGLDPSAATPEALRGASMGKLEQVAAEYLADPTHDLSEFEGFLDGALEQMPAGARAKVFKPGASARDLVRSFSAATRGKLLMKQLTSVATAAEMRRSLDALSTEDGDVVRLAEKITQELRASGEEPRVAMEKMSRLFSAMRHGLDIKDLTAGIVVIADPDTEFGQSLSDALNRVGYRSYYNATGSDAWEAVREHNPDVVVLEVKLRGIHGLEFIQQLKREGAKRGVVVCTELSEFEHDFEIETYPNHAFIQKPVEVEVVVEAVRQVTPKRPGGGSVVSSRDLEQARKIQQNLLPKELPKLSLDVAHECKFAQEVGGDYYDFIPLGSGYVGVAVGDVMGKGVPASLAMVSVRSTLRLIAHGKLSPKETLTRLNELVSPDLPRGMFITFLYLVVPQEGGTIRYASAGHNPLIHYQRARGRCSRTRTKGLAINLSKGKVFGAKLEETTLDLAPGDVACLYTDGVSEQMNDRREQFGEERMEKAIRRAAGASAAQILGSIHANVELFKGTAPQHDDSTLIILKRPLG